MLVTLRDQRVNWLVVLSFEGSRDASVNYIVAKADVKLTTTRSHYVEPSPVMNFPSSRKASLSASSRTTCT